MKRFLILMSVVVCVLPVFAQNTLTERAHLAGRGQVLDMAWSPEGARLAVSGTNGVWLYDDALENATPLPLIADDLPYVGALTWSPDGSRIAGGNAVNMRFGPNARSQTAYIWDATTHDIIHSLNIDEPGLITALEWSPDGDQLAGTVYARADPERAILIVWDVASGERLLVTPYEGKRLERLSWDANNTLVALDVLAYPAQRITIDAASGEITGSSELVAGLIPSPDGSLVALVDRQEIIVSDSANGSTLYTFTVEASARFDRFNSVVWSPDGALLVADFGRNPVQILVWDISSGTQVAQIDVPGNYDMVMRLAPHPDGIRLAYADFPGIIELVDMTSGESLSTVWHDIGAVYALAWSGEQIAATTGSDSTVYIWNASDETQVRRLEADGAFLWGLAWSPDGRLIAAGESSLEAGDPVRVLLWDAASGERLQVLEIEDSSPGDNVWQLDFSPDGSLLAATRNSNQTARSTIRVWDVANWAEVATFPEAGLADPVWSADGTRLYVNSIADFVSFNPVIHIWTLGALDDVTTIELDKYARTIQLRSGTTLLATMDDETVSIRDAQTFAALNTIASPSRRAGLTWSPDGTLLAVGSADGRNPVIDLWAVNDDGTEATLVQTLTRSEVPFSQHALAWSADGTRLASGVYDIIIWGR